MTIMHRQTLGDIIRTRAETELAGLGMDFFLPNEAFKELVDEDAGFIVVQIDFGTEIPLDIGGGGVLRLRYPGNIMFLVFLPADSGVGNAEHVADEIHDAFAWQEFSGVLCRNCRLTQQSVSSDGVGNFKGYVIECGFQYDTANE